MSNITAINTNNEIDQHIWSALKNSLYTGARDESIKMVLDYCKAAKLDPMQKPVHIVPMSVKMLLQANMSTRTWLWQVLAYIEYRRHVVINMLV